MPTLTPNLNLKKPSYDESADIAVINENMDIIDTLATSKQNRLVASDGITITGSTIKTKIDNETIVTNASGQLVALGGGGGGGYEGGDGIAITGATISAKFDDKTVKINNGKLESQYPSIIQLKDSDTAIGAVKTYNYNCDTTYARGTVPIGLGAGLKLDNANRISIGTTSEGNVVGSDSRLILTSNLFIILGFGGEHSLSNPTVSRMSDLSVTLGTVAQIGTGGAGRAYSLTNALVTKSGTSKMYSVPALVWVDNNTVKVNFPNFAQEYQKYSDYDANATFSKCNVMWYELIGTRTGESCY